MYFKGKKYRFLFSILVMFLVVASPATFANGSISIPDGFCWQKLGKIKSKVLKPRKWHCKKSVKEGNIIYSITKERRNFRGKFLTGLTINTVRNVTKKTKINAELFAAYYIFDYMEESENVLDKWERDDGVFVRYGCEVRKKISKAHPDITFRIRVSAIANTKTDTMYVVIFGCPEEEWQSVSNIEKVMVNPLVLSEKF
ncbi:MAG: hypothetical protein KAI43_05900 [Candidatus Aureabacteria bacterium]|nr:hypothetical protein [Candidatus Auribacterota bacterium]